MKGGEHVRIIIDGNPKEIAALVLAVQERQKDFLIDTGKLADAISIARRFQQEHDKPASL